MGVLLQTAGSCKCFAALRTGVAPSSDVGGPDVSLKIARICEYFVTVFTGKPAELPVNHLVSKKVWSPGEPFAAVFAHILVRIIAVVVNHMLVQSENKINVKGLLER